MTSESDKILMEIQEELEKSGSYWKDKYEDSYKAKFEGTEHIKRCRDHMIIKRRLMGEKIDD